MEIEEYARIADAERHHWWYRSMPALISTVLGPLLRPGIRILDAGCGPGANYPWLSRYGEVVGADYSPEAVRLARERHPEMEAVEADITELPFEDASFDLTIEVTVLTVVEDDRRAVAELARVTRRGGAVLLLEPAIPRLRRDHDAVQGTVRRYRLGDLGSLATGAGLTVRRSTYANSFLVAPAVALAVAQRFKRSAARPRSDLESDRLGGLFGTLAAAERRLLARRDVRFGLSAIVVAERS
ncbi:MAG TPA: class I SAM-dependent methyltransferase [Solirubrobacterales bacterium]|nr:class I SAM-dependent methyltransferase [Solirubrobacterales bacterium]